MSSSIKQRRPQQKHAHQKNTQKHTQNIKSTIKQPKQPQSEGTGLERYEILDCGTCSLQGKRPYQEDAFVCVKTNKNSGLYEHDVQGYFAIFDGHGGSQTSNFLKQSFFPHVWSHLKVADHMVSSNVKPAMKEAFLSLDMQMYEDWQKSHTETLGHSGSTAVAVVVQSDRIICANVGDSRAILAREGSIHPLSSDQRPSRADERKRLTEASVKISQNCVDAGGYLLSISRTFGDFEIKEGKPIQSNPLSPAPETMIVKPLHGDAFIILASDGLWDVFKNDEAAELVRNALRSFNGSATKAAQALANSALARKSKDNISVCVVTLLVGEVGGSEAGDDVVDNVEAPSQSEGATE